MTLLQKEREEIVGSGGRRTERKVLMKSAPQDTTKDKKREKLESDKRMRRFISALPS